MKLCKEKEKEKSLYGPTKKCNLIFFTSPSLSLCSISPLYIKRRREGERLRSSCRWFLSLVSKTDVAWFVWNVSERCCRTICYDVYRNYFSRPSSQHLKGFDCIIGRSMGSVPHFPSHRILHLLVLKGFTWSQEFDAYVPNFFWPNMFSDEMFASQSKNVSKKFFSKRVVRLRWSYYYWTCRIKLKTSISISLHVELDFYFVLFFIQQFFIFVRTYTNEETFHKCWTVFESRLSTSCRP
jgi:hypothetical protein